MKKWIFALACFLASAAYAQDIDTNEVHIHDAPKWVTQSMTQKVIDGIQTTMEWDIRKINVYWYSSDEAFGKVQEFGPNSGVLAFARRSDNTIHVGPRVDANNFAPVFGHELVHIIVYQKYKTAIPAWLDEGLANYAAHRKQVDYAWLAKQPQRDIHTLTHPFGGQVDPQYAYQASTALMEMIASHCSVHDLLQLSVGQKLEGYLGTFCGIDDLKGEFAKWLKMKSEAKH